jgi:hypothetical protein
MRVIKLSGEKHQRAFFLRVGKLKVECAATRQPLRMLRKIRKLKPENFPELPNELA